MQISEQSSRSEWKLWGFALDFMLLIVNIFLCTYPPPKMKNTLQLELEKQFAVDLKGCLLLRLFPERLVFKMMLKQNFQPCSH